MTQRTSVKGLVTVMESLVLILGRRPWSPALIGGKDLPRFDYNTIKCYITIQIQIQIQIQILKQTTIQIHGVVMLGLIGGMQKSSKIQFI